MRLRSQESFGSQSSLRTTDSNQVFGVRGPRLWNIRFCSVCSHQERSTWATWLTQRVLPPMVTSISLFRHPNSNDLPNTHQSWYRRPLNALYTATIAREFHHAEVFPFKNILPTLHTQTKIGRIQICRRGSLKMKGFKKCEIAQPGLLGMLNWESNPEPLIPQTRINPLDHWTKYLSYRAHIILGPSLQ